MASSLANIVGNRVYVPALPTNIRLVRPSMGTTNTLAYRPEDQITRKKFFNIVDEEREKKAQKLITFPSNPEESIPQGPYQNALPGAPLVQALALLPNIRLA